MTIIASDLGAPWPILMRSDEIINLKTAIHHAGRDDKTLRKWRKEFGIGRQAKLGAPIEISAPALEMVIHGDIVALELLREGKRTHPRVKRYFDHVGVPA
ncbi:hypothetical protein [Rhizobium leguminosarum]|uniref:hypothetical protein n=1 Tax=Rhizobium leguminosarum TaxID=384 RepID=UPI001C925E6E|nr:hypothetical protein [Rhizobium leguminosarum]MBY3043693.1 hypothetical protein [Rhizobium leguminosarum]